MTKSELHEISTSGWIATFTGRKVCPLAPRPEDIDIRDVAHALACINRFTGHCPEPYTVAQHSVLASNIVPPALAIAGLLHDAAEAFMGDIARPWKGKLRVVGDGRNAETGFRAAEDYLLRAIFDALKVEWPNADGWKAIKEADTTLLVTEARDFFGHQAIYNDWHHIPANGYVPLPREIVPQGWRTARHRFLERWNELTGQSVTIEN